MQGLVVVRRASTTDTEVLASMLRDMMLELFGTCAENDIMCYNKMISDHFKNKKDTIYIDSDHKGFFIVRDETEICVPGRKIYNGVRVYIKPEYRKTRLLKRFYDRLYQDFLDGEIWGLTEINSEHIPVMDKRHECVAKVYKLRRPN